MDIINKLYINDDSYVYTSCGDRIIVLKKLSETLTNEQQMLNCLTNNGKIFRQWCQYNANKLLVVNIINKFKSQIATKSITYSSITHNITYTIGKITTDAKGINYFTNPIRALYEDLENVANGEFYKWYENGQLKLKCVYVNEELNGEYHEWYENGKLKLKCTFQNNMLVGKYIEFYSNGNNAVNYTYFDGVKNGIYKKWYENGVLSEFGNYENGLRHSAHIEYHITKNISKICNYCNGVLHGSYLENFENNNVYIKCEYVNGYLNGEYLEYSYDNILCKKCYYINDMLNDEYVEYDNQGEIITYLLFENNCLVN